MKKKLLNILPLLFVFLTLGAYSQTGALADLAYDATLEQGASDKTFTFTYTSDVEVEIEWQLVPANEDGSPNWGGGQISYNKLSGTYPATATPTEVSFTYSVGGTAGDTYTWAGKLTSGGADFAYNNTGNLVTITASAAVLYTVEILNDLPTAVAPGDIVTANIHYTLTNDGQVKFALQREGGTTNDYNVLGNEVSIDPAAATDAAGVTTDLAITIPAETPASSTLESGESYKLVVAIFEDSWNWKAQVATDVTIESLGIDGVNVNGVAVYPNPVKSKLFIDNSKLQAKSLVIYDVAGRTVRRIANLDQVKSIDVENLNQGMYFLVTNNKKQLKFIKN